MSEVNLPFDLLHPQPLLVVICGLSGSGKDAAIQELKNRGVSFHFVITATSRPQRPDEIDGVSYFFLSRQEFEEKIVRDEMLEYANVYDQYKGVPKDQVRQAMQSGKDVIMRLDVQGAMTIRSKCPDAVLIFIVPGSQEEWLRRLRNRGTESPEQFAVRLEKARGELQQALEFDYIVVNEDNCLDKAADHIMAIIQAEHLRPHPRSITL